LVFFAEDRADWIHIGPIADRLEAQGKKVLRLTADPADLVIGEKGGLFTGGMVATTRLLVSLPSCIVVTTMTDLDTFHLKRSINDVTYIYIFHSILSTHRAYRDHAFDAYDVFLCVGPHHVAELARSQEVYGLNRRELLETGYCRLDYLIEQEQHLPPRSDSPINVLLAPTWGPSSLTEYNLESIIEELLHSSIEVVMRFHPMTTRHQPQLGNQLMARYGEDPNFSLDKSFDSIDALIHADVIITEWSGVAHEFAYGLLRPAVFVDTPKKIHNDNYQHLTLECYEDGVRESLGALVDPDEIGSIPDLVTSLVEGREDWRSKLAILRDRHLFNPGGMVPVAVEQIIERMDGVRRG
jgi:YidC/Oxa1 family membrane protein insertase